MASDKLRIGFVFDDSLDKADGVQQYILALGNYFTDSGHEVHYLTGQSCPQDNLRIHSLSRNVAVGFNGNRMSIPLPVAQRSVQRLLTDLQLDVLHVQMPYSPWLAQRVILAARQDTAVIGTFHIVAYSQLVSVATKLLATWTRSSLKRFDDIVSVSSAAQAYAAATYHIASSILPNTFDYSRFQTAVPITSEEPGKKTILFLGRLVERKGCMQLLKAIVWLREHTNHVNDLRVSICGKGPLEPELRSYVIVHSLTDVVTFKGYVSETEKPSYYAAADIAVFPSSGGESFGIVLLEAMASGRAVVLGGNNAGYAAVLKDEPKLLFDAKDEVVLGSKIAHFLDDESDRQRLAQWGMHYTAQYDTNIVGEKLLKRYRDALRKRR